MAEPVTVIITCFNLERYIEVAIQSVLDQNYGGQIEIIVVDDCSTDSSPAIIGQFPQIRYLRTSQNGGVLLAMIAGFRAASHDLLFLLDGDDLWAPDKVAAVAARFEANPRLVFATHDIQCIDGKGTILPIPSRPAKRLAGVAQDQVSAVLRSAALAMGDFIPLGSAMTIRRSLADVDGFIAFAEKLPDPANTYQDWPLVAWCAVQPEVDFGYIPQLLYSYRVHGANHSGDASSVDKAVRNLRRTHNTIDAAIRIARTAGAAPSVIADLTHRRDAIHYLIELTSGRYRSAVASFVRGFPDLRKRGLVLKEIVRLIGMMLLGPGRFLKLSSNRAVLKSLPTT